MHSLEIQASGPLGSAATTLPLMLHSPADLFQTDKSYCSSKHFLAQLVTFLELLRMSQNVPTLVLVEELYAIALPTLLLSLLT